MSSTPLRADVLVVGAGPAGAAAAALLAAEGLRVVLAEASPAPRDKVCGEFLSAEALPILARLGALAAVRAAGPEPLRRAAFHPPHGPPLEISLPEAGCLGVSRAALDGALQEAAAARGVRLLRGARFAEPLRRHDGVVEGAWLVTSGGPLRVEAPLLVGADGRSSPVARALGLERPAAGRGRCGIKVHVIPGPAMGSLAGAVEILVFPGGYVGMQPVEGGRVNVSGVVDARLARRIGGGAVRILFHAAAAHPVGRILLEGCRPVGPPRSLYPLVRRRAAVAGDGFLLAGDAAAVVPPFTGDGIAAALRSGTLAAEAAAAALRAGDLSAGGLAAYGAARRRHLQPPLRAARLLERLLHHTPLAAAAIPALRRVPLLAPALLRLTRVSR